MYYAQEIARLAPTYDPRHIEAFMRLEHGTLDRLTASAFAREVRLAALCIDTDKTLAENLAKSYGL